MNFQIFKLDLEKAEKPGFKLPASIGQKSKRVPEKYLFLLYLLCRAFDCVDHHKLWKILKEMGMPECLLRNLYAGEEATVRTGGGTTDWSIIARGAHECCILSPAYLTSMQST